MMVSAVNGNRVELGDLESVGVRLDERAQMVSFSEQLLRLGLSEFEVHPALELFIRNQKWATRSQWVRHGIVQSAKELVRRTKELDEAAKRAASHDTLQMISLADVIPEPVRWLWPGKIPLGQVTVVYGDAGLGKTCWSLDLAARVSSGIGWPDEVGESKQGSGGGSGEDVESGKVVLINGEDQLHETICPRLTSGGARLENVLALSRITSKTPDGANCERRFDLGRDIPLLRQHIENLGDVRLVIVDSLQACCGSVRPQSWRMRALLAELGELAEDYDIAVVVISAGHKCSLPVKHVWRVDRDVLDPSLRWWVSVRSPGGPLASGIAFRVTADGLVWDSQAGLLTPDRVRGAEEQPSRISRLSEVAVWLKEHLTLGRCASNDVFRAGAAAGWSAWQIKRAKLALRITCYKEPMAKGRWIWELPRQPGCPAPQSGFGVSNVVPPANEVPQQPVGLVIADRIDCSAAALPENPLEWLDRASKGIGIRIPTPNDFKQFKEPSEIKGSEGSKENCCLQKNGEQQIPQGVTSGMR